MGQFRNLVAEKVGARPPRHIATPELQGFSAPTTDDRIHVFVFRGPRFPRLVAEDSTCVTQLLLVEKLPTTGRGLGGPVKVNCC